MKKNLLLLSCLMSTLAVTSCAHNKNAQQKVETEMKEVSASQTKSIDKTIKEQISSSNLTDQQKEKLMALEEKAHADNTAITEEIERAKIVLIQTILAPKMSQREFSILKKKIISLDKKRLENGLKAVTEVRKIVNPEAANAAHHAELYKVIIENRLRGF